MFSSHYKGISMGVGPFASGFVCWQGIPPADTQRNETKVYDFLSMDLPIAKHEELFANGKLSRRKSDDYCVSTNVVFEKNIFFLDLLIV